MSLWVICLTTNDQCFNYILPTLGLFVSQWDEHDDSCFVLDQTAELDCHSASSIWITQRSTVKQVAPHGYIILTSWQLLFAIIPWGPFWSWTYDIWIYNYMYLCPFNQAQLMTCPVNSMSEINWDMLILLRYAKRMIA